MLGAEAPTVVPGAGEEDPESAGKVVGVEVVEDHLASPPAGGPFDDGRVEPVSAAGHEGTRARPGPLRESWARHPAGLSEALMPGFGSAATTGAREPKLGSVLPFITFR